MRLLKSIFISLLLFSSISAQYIGISFSKTWTDNYELENPNGFSINISRPLFGKFDIQFEYSKFENRREFFGHVISGFLTPPLPPKEIIQSESTLQVYEFSVKYFVLKLDDLNLALGVGFSLNKMDGRRLGTESGSTASLFDEDSFGISGIFYAESRVIRFLPLTIYAAVQKKQIAGGQEATGVESPFSNSLDTFVLQTGVKFKF